MEQEFLDKYGMHFDVMFDTRAKRIAFVRLMAEETEEKAPELPILVKNLDVEMLAIWLSSGLSQLEQLFTFNLLLTSAETAKINSKSLSRDEKDEMLEQRSYAYTLHFVLINDCLFSSEHPRSNQEKAFIIYDLLMLLGITTRDRYELIARLCKLQLLNSNCFVLAYSDLSKAGQRLSAAVAMLVESTNKELKVPFFNTDRETCLDQIQCIAFQDEPREYQLTPMAEKLLAKKT
jgi:hypothetical protein